MIKALYKAGYRSEYIDPLVKMWRELIEEMGGVNGGGTIIHYAHSLGGSDTDRARSLLSPEEQAMIRVVTFGSPTWMKNEGFQSVINIISKKDLVSALFDPHGRWRNFFDSDSNVHYNTSSSGWFEHSLECDAYNSVITKKGEEFLEEFL